MNRSITCRTFLQIVPVEGTAGGRKGGLPWRIGIMAPRKTSPSKQVVLPVTEKAVTTSGDSFQYFTPGLQHHLLQDSRTGYSSPELANCSSTAPEVLAANGQATAVTVLGKNHWSELLESMDGYEGYLIDKKQNRHHTSNFFS